MLIPQVVSSHGVYYTSGKQTRTTEDLHEGVKWCGHFAKQFSSPPRHKEKAQLSFVPAPVRIEGLKILHKMCSQPNEGTAQESINSRKDKQNTAYILNISKGDHGNTHATTQINLKLYAK